MNLLRTYRLLGVVWLAFVIFCPRVFAQAAANSCVSSWVTTNSPITLNVASNPLVCLLEPMVVDSYILPPYVRWTDTEQCTNRPDDVGDVTVNAWTWNVSGNTAPDPSAGTGSVAVFANYHLGTAQVTFTASGTYTLDGQIHPFTLTESSPDVQVIDRIIAMDGNQDLQIDMNSTNDNHCLFWVNDDYDVEHWVAGGSANGWAEDDDRDECGDTRNCDDDCIGRKGKDELGYVPIVGEDNCLRDLEDFTVVQLKVPSILSSLDGITYVLKFEQCTNGSPLVKLFRAVANGVMTPFDYLTNSTVANFQVAETNAYTIDSSECGISTNDIDRYDQPISFLMEGCAAGNADMVFVVKKGCAEICRSKVRLDLRNITDFYDIYKACRDDPVQKIKWEAEVSNQCSQVQTNFAYPARSDQYLLLVHGWNMTADDKLYFAQTAFKRLWWQGYKGGFGLFDWPTLDSFNLGLNTPTATHPGKILHHYDDSEMIAWLSATALANLMGPLNSSGQLRLWAHSMGNVVVGEALRKYAGVNKIKAYIASQAAISGAAYSQTAPDTDFSFSFSPNWYGPDTPRLFDFWGSGNTNSADKPYFDDNSAEVDRMCNYYNPDDYALDWWEVDNKRKPDDVKGYAFAYGGSSGSYSETTNSTSRFYRWEDPTKGLNVLVEADLQDRYAVFAYALESWSQALGQATNSAFANTNLNLQVLLNYDKRHYSHSRQFRSNILDEWKYYRALTNDGGL